MYIALDVMGGDNAPHAPVQGAIKALKNNLFNLKIILIGDELKISLFGGFSLEESIKVDMNGSIIIPDIGKYQAKATVLKPNFAANSNDNESESTGWKDPSLKVTLRESISKPAKGPFFIASLKPFSTEGIYSFGTLPPFILFINSNPTCSSSPGSIVNTISANLPLPPVCFL